MFFLITALFLSSCSTLFASGQVESDRTWLGESKTTLIQASPDGSGHFSLIYEYADSYALMPEWIIVDTDSGRTAFKPANITEQKLANGRIRESGSLTVNRTLLEQMADSDSPVIYIKGKQGTVIIKMGTRGKKNLRDLLAGNK